MGRTGACPSMTRIIGGTAGCRRLQTNRGQTTRPTSDRVREALFASVESWCGSLAGLRFLDLYAGSGAVGLERTAPGQHELGYWIGEPWWSMGIATEAAGRIVRFAIEDLGARVLNAGYLYDNPASGRVLAKCGFVLAGEVLQWCEARGQAVKCHRLTLAIGGRGPGMADVSAKR